MAEETIFSKIIRREIPSDIVYQDELVTAFRDISPQAPTHILIVPNVLIPTVNDVTAEHELALGRMMTVAAKIARDEGLADDGYRLIVNCNRHGGQEVYHIHMHLLGGRPLGPMLAHKGVHEGHVAAEVISGLKHYFDPKVIPSIAYTEPEVAWVGLTEKEAKEKGISYETATFPWAASGRAIASDCADGMTKLIFDKETHRVIGGAIVGTNGGELLGEIGLAIEMGCDAEDIALTIHAHPTLHESVGLAAEVFEGSIADLPNAKAKKK